MLSTALLMAALFCGGAALVVIFLVADDYFNRVADAVTLLPPGDPELLDFELEDYKE